VSARLRILHLQTDSGLAGGVANYISALTTAARGGPCDDWVTVAPDAVGASKARAMYPGASLLAMPPTYSAWRSGAYVERLAQFVEAEGIQVLHAHAARAGFAAAAVARRTGCPLVYTNHGLRFSQKSSWLASAMFEQAERRICDAARAVVCVRPFDEAVLRQRGWVDSSKLRTIRTRLDVPLADRQPKPVQRPVLIGCGSLIGVKRPDRFLRWLGALSAMQVPFEAHWLGDGPLLPRMKALAEELGVSVQWHGHLNRLEVLDWMQRASLLLLTSEFEVFPLAVMEGYASALPVVATRFAGVRDVVAEGVTGILVEGESPAQAAAAIADLWRRPEALAEMGRQAQAFFAQEHQGVVQMRAAYDLLYRHCVSESHP
jgi:colanic acid/amylovoran biosynthesis glycosyltransferase